MAFDVTTTLPRWTFKRAVESACGGRGDVCSKLLAHQQVLANWHPGSAADSRGTGGHTREGGLLPGHRAIGGRGDAHIRTRQPPEPRVRPADGLRCTSRHWPPALMLGPER